MEKIVKCIICLWLIFCLVSVASASPELRYDVEATLVRVSRGSDEIFRYPFDRPQHIHDVEVSPSGYYVYLWHSPKPPRRLKIFRLTDKKLVADFVPGYGGALLWTTGDKLMHTWGCGTACQSIRVYDIAGGILHEEVASGSELTEFGYYVVFATAGDWKSFGLKMYDVNSGRHHVLLPEIRDIPSNVVCLKDRVRVEFDEGPAETIDLKPFFDQALSPRAHEVD